MVTEQKETLNAYLGVRLSRKELRRAKELLKLHPDRFENVSHMARAGLQVLMRKLEIEALDKIYQQERLSRRRPRRSA